MEQQKNNRRSSKPNPEQKPYLKYSGVAFEVVAFNLLVIWGGYELDEYLENEVPWSIITASLLAVTGTIYHLLKRLNE